MLVAGQICTFAQVCSKLVTKEYRFSSWQSGTLLTPEYLL